MLLSSAPAMPIAPPKQPAPLLPVRPRVLPDLPKPHAPVPQPSGPSPLRNPNFIPVHEPAEKPKA
jgi:hypothetical protein